MTIFRLSLTDSLFFRPWKGCLVQERPGVARLAHTNTASQTHTYETCPALRLSPPQHFYRDTLDLFPLEDRCLGLLGCLTTESASGAESLCIPLSFYWWRIVSFKGKKALSSCNFISVNCSFTVKKSLLFLHCSYLCASG